MAITNYFTINGQLVGETGPGGIQYYHTDALGSVTTTTDQSAHAVNTYRFKPFGGSLSNTGTASDPAYLWGGALGYMYVNRSHFSSYVRARHFDVSSGTWNNLDPRWPSQASYVYVNGSPVSWLDPTGLGCGEQNYCDINESVFCFYARNIMADLLAQCMLNSASKKSCLCSYKFEGRFWLNIKGGCLVKSKEDPDGLPCILGNDTCQLEPQVIECSNAVGRWDRLCPSTCYKDCGNETKTKIYKSFNFPSTAMEADDATDLTNCHLKFTDLKGYFALDGYVTTKTCLKKGRSG